MDLSLTKIGNENMHLHDSGIESRMQIVFIPGLMSASAWRYQLNYFSEDYRSITFRPTISNRNYKGHRDCLEQILQQESMNNVVLVGANYSNSLAQEFEEKSNVSATVLVGAKEKMKKGIPKDVYNIFTSEKFPCKLFKKLFLPSMRFENVKEFCNEVKFLEFEDFKSFRSNFGIRPPEKESMIIHPESDFFSDQDFSKSMMARASVTKLQSGSFGFYEKPQEFNKILHDFLVKIERKAIKEKIEEEREKNKTLAEFEEKKVEVRK